MSFTPRKDNLIKRSSTPEETSTCITKNSTIHIATIGDDDELSMCFPDLKGKLSDANWDLVRKKSKFRLKGRRVVSDGTPKFKNNMMLEIFSSA